MKRGIVGATKSQEEVAIGRGPARTEEDRGRGQGASGTRQVVFMCGLVVCSSGSLCWRVSIVESSSRPEKRARMESLAPTQQLDEEQGHLVGPAQAQRRERGQVAEQPRAWTRVQYTEIRSQP